MVEDCRRDKRMEDGDGDGHGTMLREDREKGASFTQRPFGNLHSPHSIKWIKNLGNMYVGLIVMVPLISYYQLYLPCGRKRVFEEGYGRMFAERPTGSRASRQSASSGQSILGQMTQSHPSTKSHHQKTPNPYLRRPCRSLPRLIASR